MVFTNNHAPVAALASYTRGAGTSLRIKLADLTNNWSDADGDPVLLASVSAASTNSVSITSDSTYIYYSVGTNNNTADAITYTIADTNSYYRAGIDTERTAVGTILINVNTNVVGQTQSITVTNGTATVNFAGVPGYPYAVERGTNVNFTGTVDVLVTTNAPAGGYFNWTDTNPPTPSGFYRLRYNP